MSLSGVYTALLGQLQGTPPGQSIDLYTAAAAEPALSPLLGVLARLGITSSWTLTGATLVQSAGAVALAGAGTWGLPGALPAHVTPVGARLSVTSGAGGADVFELTLSPTDRGWTFGTTFPNLPVTQKYVPQGVAFAPSFLEGLALGSPAFFARSDAPAGAPAGMRGQMWPWDDLSQGTTDFLSPWPLRLEGTVALPATANGVPLLDLKALQPAATLQLLSATVREVGLQIMTSTGLSQEDYGTTSFSVLNLVGTLYLGAVDPITVHVFTPLLATAGVWRLMAGFDPGEATLSAGLAQVASLFGVPPSTLPVPPGFDSFGGFYVSLIEVAVTAPGEVESFPDLQYVAITLGSDKEWAAPIPYVRIRDVGTRWIMGWSTVGAQSRMYVSGSVYGSVWVGGAPWSAAPGGRVLRDPDPADDLLLLEGGSPPSDAFRLDVVALIPQFVVQGQLRTDDRIPIGSALRYYFGTPGPPSPADMRITALSFEAAPLASTYYGAAVIEMEWTLHLGGNVALTLEQLSFYIHVDQGSVTGGIAGEFLLEGGAPPGLPQPRFTVSAEYTGTEPQWVFSGALYPDTYLELVALVSSFLGVTPPAGLPTLALEALNVRIETGTGAYAVAGRVAGRWTVTLFGTELAFSAIASADVQKTAGADHASGRLEGRFAVNRFSVAVGMDVGVEEPTYQFRVQFGELWLSATTGWRGEKETRHQVLTLQLGGVTLGGILEYLVNLAAPTLGFTLDPPWDVLNRIELSRFQLVLDAVESTVELTYRVDADLVFARVDTVGVRYQRVNGEGVVDLVLTGRFLDRTYDSAKPLAWDVVRDPPPAVPGKGTSLIDLRYLGLGQRVALRDTASLNTVRETLARLQEDMQPPAPGQNPLAPGGGGAALEFAADSQWLIGLDVSLLEDTVSLGLIFNDPRLYGLSVALGGERAGAMAGLRFEILYKKISADIGMFRVELQLPEAFRRIELGSVSITLGLIVVEVYTNGNFLVDLGFPYDRDFGRAFTVQVFPFIGRGGIYFGLLNGTTSRRVPAITNGTFAPVLELGIGLAVGVGKEVRIGPLSGGVYVQVEVLFQGVLAWFNPSSSGTAPAKYYWVQAVAAIHGKLYGKVDFKVIKVSVTVEAYAQASVTMEAYRPAVFRLNVGVSVEAEVEILFFSVSFSFDITLDVSFTVGSEQPTPWILAAGGGGGSAAGTTAQRLRAGALPPATRRPARRTELLRTQHAALLARSLVLAADAPADARMAEPADDVPPYLLRWDPWLPVFDDAPRGLPLTLLPAFSLAAPPVDWTGDVPLNPQPQYRAAFLAFAENGLPPGGGRAGAAERSAEGSLHAAATGELPLDTLMEALLRWSIAAVTGDGSPPADTVTAGQMALLAEQMDRPETSDTGFSRDGLAAFFTTNLVLEISGDPSGTPDGVGGAVFPVPPPLSWTSPQAPARDFAVYNPVGPLYEWGAARYAAALFPLPSPAGEPPVEGDDPAHYESFAWYLFRDACLMVARAAVQAARDALAAWAYPVEAPVSLADVASDFPAVDVDYAVRAGDTVDSVASALGASAAELAFLNPGLADELRTLPAGAVIPVALGVAPQAVALDNATVPTAPGVPLPLGTLEYQAAQADTLGGIASRFGLPDAAALFSGTPLGADERLLNAGAAFTAPQSPWTPPDTCGTMLAAATFYVRYFGRTGVPYASWYADTAFQWNQDGALAGVAYDAPLPPGLLLEVPAALDETGSPPSSTVYTTLPGDTLPRLGAALALAQNFASGSGPETEPAWAPFRDAVAASGGSVVIPAAEVAVLPDESVSMLADRTLVHAGDVPGLLDWIGAAPLLRPLATLSVQGVTADTGAGASLASIAQRYGLGVDDLAGRIAHVPGLFPVVPDAPVRLSINHLPVQTVDALVDAVLAGEAPGQVSGMISRQLLSGLRLPAPETVDGHAEATGALTALYDLSGQQVPAPAPDPDAPDTVALEVTVTVDPDTPWVRLVDSATAGDPDAPDALLTAAPDAARWNRAMHLPGRLRPGMVVRLGEAESLVFSYTNGQLQGLYPDTGLAVDPLRGPRALTLAGEAPRTYGLDYRIEVQTPVPLPIPAVAGEPLAGNPTLWPFDAALRDRARGGSTTPYEVVAASNREDGSTRTDTVLDATWGALLPFGVRRLAETDHVYGLRGADTVARAVLLQLRDYLAGSPAGSARAWLLVAPSPDTRNPSGLTLIDVVPDRTFLLQTNLSTESVAPSGARLLRRSVEFADEAEVGSPPTAGAHYASIADLEPFVRLLWEGSVVAGEGYWLGFAAADGGGIPASAFDEQGNATLYLLAMADDRQAVAPAGRPLLPWENCALVGAGLESSAHALAVEAADGSEQVRQALVPPGSTGWTLTLPRPPAQSSPPDPQTQLQQLFSLAAWQVQAAAPFSASQPALPVGPQAEDGEHLPLARRLTRARQARARQALMEAVHPAALHAPRALPGPAGLWRYEQVVPVYRLGPPSYAPAVPGLPDPADDPYRGVGGQSSQPKVSMQIGFADVLGNVTAPPSGGGAVTADAGYTDPLLGVSAWPGVTTAWAVSADGAPRLTVTVAPQAAAAAPTALESAGGTREAALRQAEKYAQAWFQLAQPDVTAALLTALLQDGHGAPAPVAVDVAPLRAFAGAAYVAAAAAAALTPVRPAASASLSLRAVADGWRASWAALAAANADQPVYALLGAQPLTVPAFGVFAEGETADGVSATAPPGWPRPGGATLLGWTENADVLPLRPGIVLTTPRRPVAADGTGPTPPLDALAAGAGTTAALLAADNAFAFDVLQPGFVFWMDGLSVAVDATQDSPPSTVETFDDVRQAFAALGVNATVRDIAAANGGMPGMIAPGAVLSSYHYLADADDTLGRNGSTFGADDLAPLNAGTANLFDAGALVYLGDFAPAPAAEPGSPETLAAFAARWAVPVEQLLAANAGVALPAGSALVVPGAGGVPAEVHAGYTLRAGDVLNDVAARFAPAPGTGTPAQTLAAANAALPGTLAPGQTLTVTVSAGTAQTTTQAGDSFASALARLQAQVPSIQLDDLVSAIAGTAGYLDAGGLLVAPPAVLPGSGAAAPDAVPGWYGVDAASFAQANAGTDGLIVPGVTVSAPDGRTLVTVAHETFNSLVAGFAAAGSPVSIAQVVSGNEEVAFLAAGARALLPPAAVVLAAPLPAVPGPFAEPVFPLTAALRLQRPPALVHPDFRTDGTGPVERVDTPVPAPPSEEGPGALASLTLSAFTDTFQAVFPTLRLASAKVEGVQADLWGVDFGAGGIARVDVGPGVPAPGGGWWPRFFALRPLYNDLVTRLAVPIATLEEGGTLSHGTEPMDFQGVDVEVWARRFLEDLDRFLTAPYAGAAYLDPAARTALAGALEAKGVLGPAVARGLAPVLDVADPQAAAGLEEASRVLGESLAVSLAGAYDTSAVLQYDAEVDSAWTHAGSTLPPARLEGPAREAGAASPPDASPPSPGRPFTLAGAKTALDQARSFVTFLMRVSDPAHHGQVPVDLEYPLLNLEFNVAPVQGVEGYRASDWAAFVDPLAGADLPAGVNTSLGASTVPIPLRAYPALPVLLEQAARPTVQGVPHPSLGQVVQWTYALTYSHEHAVQDEVLVGARFNIPPRVEANAFFAGEPDVAEELAQYAAVADPLWALLAGFADPARGVDSATLASAAHTFGGLARRVASAWNRRWPVAAQAGMETFAAEPAPAGAPGEQVYGFRVRLLDADGPDGVPVLAALVLVREQAQPGPAGAWPDVFVRTPDGGELPLLPGEPHGAVRIYTFPGTPVMPAVQWPIVTLAWGGLSVAQVQNARASLAVRRNQKLLGEDGPDTTAGFIYRTPLIEATDVVTPLNTWPQRLDISSLGGTVEQALQAAFDALFGPGAQLPVTIGMSYGYELVPPSADSDGLVTYLPVGLYPGNTLDPGTAAAVAAALALWEGAVQPSTTSAEWAFALTLYSQLDPSATRPLLQLERLVYRIPSS
ncbi:MAG TPA: LysM peptidoglycan-binding domain-containing protein [Longimicrobium sp.]|nr:LysM peptidoglycan-binding domain-containing protein [Longimicrobium sp.]